MICFIFWFY